MLIKRNCRQLFVAEGFIVSFVDFNDRCTFILLHINSHNDQLFLTPFFCIASGKQYEEAKKLNALQEKALIEVQGKIRLFGHKKLATVYVDRINIAVPDITKIEDDEVKKLLLEAGVKYGQKVVNTNI